MALEHRRNEIFLDKFCKDIISLGVSQADLATKRPNGGDVLVAFGDAKDCFGRFWIQFNFSRTLEAQTCTCAWMLCMSC